MTFNEPLTDRTGDEPCYIVATVKPWNLEAFHRHADTLPGDWVLIQSPDQLTKEALDALSPKMLFFPHWSWRVPNEILSSYECVCFHMADVPYGRGGSPLQNLILRGHEQTQLSALRMVEKLDAGPVYCKDPLSLDGSAQEIYEALSELVYRQIRRLISENIEPQDQVGDIFEFTRRQPAQSELPCGVELTALYDHIRMLDAETYPKAFIELGDWRLEFSDAKLLDGEVGATVVFKQQKTKEQNNE